MKTYHPRPDEPPGTRSIAQRASTHHANSGSGAGRGAPLEDDPGAPLAQRQAITLDSPQSGRLAELHRIANAGPRSASS